MRLYIKDKNGLYTHFLDISKSDVEYRTNGTIHVSVEPEQVTPALVADCDVCVLTKVEIKSGNYRAEGVVITCLAQEILSCAENALTRVENKDCNASTVLDDVLDLVNTISKKAKNIQEIISQ